MNRSRLIAATGGAVTLLLTAGTALALSVGGDGTQGTVGAAQTTEVSTTESTTDSTSESTTETSTSTSENSASTHHTAPPAGAPAIDSALAVDIALTHVGGGVVTNVEREMEHGRLEWKVRIERDGNRYDVRVDAATGAITRVDAKDDDDSGKGRGRGGDDKGKHGDDDRDRGHDDRSGRG